MSLTTKGQPNGLATLDATGKLPSAQLPADLAGFDQAAAVADQAALTASAPAALTSAALTGGESPTEAEYNLLQADVVALRATVAALVVDLTASRTKVNALLTSLRTANLLDT